jgi:hypothetical protein
MKIRKSLLKREIAGESFLVPLGKTVYDSNGLFVLTELGSFIWDRLPEAESAEDILKAILAEYDVEEATARADLEKFLEKLREMEILE